MVSSGADLGLHVVDEGVHAGHGEGGGVDLLAVELQRSDSEAGSVGDPLTSSPCVSNRRRWSLMSSPTEPQAGS